MDCVSSIAVAPSMMVPPHTTTPLHRHHTLSLSLSLPFSPTLPCRIRSRRRDDWVCRAKSSSKSDGGEGEEEDDVEVDRALRLDGSIPGTSKEFVEQVSSRAYDMRRHLHESLGSATYDVLDANPWRDKSKPVYVLTQKENQLCTMKTRQNRSEVEKELGLLFSKGRKRGSDFGNQTKQSRNGKKFQMVVEDVREGILVFEDQNEAVRYCDLLQGGCEGVAEIEASYVFDLCRNSRALAVLFRRGRTPPQPESLKLNLGARKHSLED